jgi:hypothetical protein
MPRFFKCKGHRKVGLYRFPHNFTAVRMNAGRNIHGADKGFAFIDFLHRFGKLSFQIPGKPYTK